VKTVFRILISPRVVIQAEALQQWPQASCLRRKDWRDVLVMCPLFQKRLTPAGTCTGAIGCMSHSYLRLDKMKVCILGRRFKVGMPVGSHILFNTSSA